MKLLSVILPMYNVEPFVEKCVRSLLHQELDPEEYEIICVNDGSPDNGREVVSHLREEAGNILLIDQENQGVSAARNKGIENATGKYLLLVDPDDFIRENSLAPILSELESRQAQLAIPGYIYMDPDGREQGRKIFSNYTGQVYSGIEAFHLMRKERHIITDSCVGIIYETEFLKKHRLFFKPGVVLNQDAELKARIHCLAERCIFLDQVLYIVQERIGSATHSDQLGKERVRNGFILAASNLRQFQQEGSLSEEQRSFLNGPIAQNVLLALYSGMKAGSRAALRMTFRDLKGSGLRRLHLKGGSAYHKICGSFYNLSPGIGAVVLVFYLKMEHLYYSRIVKTNG